MNTNVCETTPSDLKPVIFLCFLPLRYGDASFKMDHLILNFLFNFFKRQICFDSSVDFAYFSSWNDVLWFAQRVLNVLDVIPM